MQNIGRLSSPLAKILSVRGVEGRSVGAVMDLEIRGLRVLVTAGGSGIGLAIARRFAGEGEWAEAPGCVHGTWTVAGADFKRRRTKWRCPSGECSPASTWVKADRRRPLVPRGTRRFRDFYAGRGAVERVLAAQERVRPDAAPHAWTRASRATRRPRDARPSLAGARARASRSARGVSASLEQEAGPTTDSRSP